jgi:hypothetical protein
MRAKRISIEVDELDKAASVARKLDHAARLSDLTYDVMCRQAEGRSLFTGERFVAGRAEAHEVTRDQAATPYGNLLTILENGPDSNMKWALLAALFVQGFAQALQAAEEGASDALLARFIGHCDWLELCSPFRIQPLFGRVLPEAQAASLMRAIADAVLRDDSADNDAETRGQNAARICALAADKREAGREQLVRIAAEAKDPCSGALASAFAAPQAGGRDSVSSERPQEALSLTGRLGRFPSTPGLSLVRWLTGWALVAWFARLLSTVLGLRRRARVSLVGQALRVEREVVLMGKTVRAHDEVYSLGQLRLARRSRRFPFVHLLAGVVSFAFGIIVGGMFLFDALRVGELPLLGIAGAILLGGAGLDLLLEVVVPGGKGRIALDLDLGKGSRTRLTGVAQAQADPFLGALAAAIERGL